MDKKKGLSPKGRGPTGQTSEDVLKKHISDARESCADDDKDRNISTSNKKDINFWLEKVDAAGKRENDWQEKAKQYECKYLNEQSLSAHALSSGKYLGRYNIFYSNTELLKAALLPEIPQIVLTRRFAKEQAENAKEKQFYTTVSEVVERAITYNVKNIGIEKEFEAFKYDYLITGRGILWVKFTIDDVEEELEQSFEELSSEEQSSGQSLNERILIEHVHFKDFRMSSGNNWKEVWWVGRRHLFNREDLIKRFGRVGKSVSLDYEDKDNRNSYVKDEKQAEVWEIWDKLEKKVHFVSPGYQLGILKTVEDPYHLDDFFPTPEPLRSVRSNRSLIPTPELDLYIREAQDLSMNAKRLSDIVDAIRPRAFYAAQFESITKALQNADDNEYVGVDDIPRIMEIGGMQNMFAYDPIDTKQAVCAGLAKQQENLIQNIYEITGISDIMRNISADETATATLQKGKFGSLRLQERQTSINNYVKSVYKIATELVCELFTVKTLQDITSMKLPTNEELMQFQMEMQAQQQMQQQMQAQGAQAPQMDPQRVKFFENPTWEQVKEFLEDNRLRAYLIDIETSFNIWENDEQSQRSRVDLLNVFSESVSKALPIITQAPQLSEIYLKLISFSMDSFRMSRNVRNQIEDSFTEMIENIKKAQEQPKPQEPAPEQLIAQAEVMKAQAEQMNAQTKVKEAEIKVKEVEIKAQEVEIKAASVAAEIEIDKQKLVTDTQIAAENLRIKNNNNIIR